MGLSRAKPRLGQSQCLDRFLGLAAPAETERTLASSGSEGEGLLHTDSNSQRSRTDSAASRLLGRHHRGDRERDSAPQHPNDLRIDGQLKEILLESVKRD